jgi:hypothetical protein
MAIMEDQALLALLIPLMLLMVIPFSSKRGWPPVPRGRTTADALFEVAVKPCCAPCIGADTKPLLKR